MAMNSEPRNLWLADKTMNCIEICRDEFLSRGFAIVRAPSLRKREFLLLDKESKRQRKLAWLCEKIPGSAFGVAQRNMRAELGEYASQFFISDRLTHFVEFITGWAIEASYAASCLTYYESEKDFLSIHTDRVDECTVTILLYIEVSPSTDKPPGPGLMLNIYKKNKHKYIPVYSITPCSNMICLLKGSQIPHGRELLQEGECVRLLALCFKTRDAS